MEVRYEPGGNLSPAVTVMVGEELVITLVGPEAYGWGPVTVEHGPLEVVGRAADAGTVTARVLAVGPGVGEVRSTSFFRGDRFGPQTRLWRLRVEVTGPR